MGLDTKDKDYRKIYFALHYKYPFAGINYYMSELDDDLEEMAYCRKHANHKFNSADPVLAVTFKQRYSNKVVRKHNKRRHK